SDLVLLAGKTSIVKMDFLTVYRKRGNFYVMNASLNMWQVKTKRTMTRVIVLFGLKTYCNKLAALSLFVIIKSTFPLSISASKDSDSCFENPISCSLFRNS